MSKKYIIVIDEGTTDCRALLFDRKFNVVGSAYETLHQFHPAPMEVEMDSQEIYHKVVICLRRVVQECKIDPKDIECIGFTYQRGTWLFWDKVTGVPYYRAVVWLDTRGNIGSKHFPANPELVRRYPSVAATFRKNPGTWCAIVYRFLEEHPEIREKILTTPTSVFGRVDSWMMYKLTGNHRCDKSVAGQFFGIDKGDGRPLWESHNYELLELLGMNEHMLPEICDTAFEYGIMNKSILGVEIPIRSCFGDQQSALFGEGCQEAGTAKCTLGTGAFADVNVGEKKMPDIENLWSMVGWSIQGKCSYLLEGYLPVAGSCLQWARDNLKLFDSFKELDELAGNVPDCGGVYFVPGLTGLNGPPFNDPTGQGSFMGISSTATKEHFCRALVESMGYIVAGLFNSIPNITMKRIFLDGGASKSNITCQTVANVTGASVYRPKMVEATALGAAEMAAIQSGWYTVSDVRDVLKGFGADVFESDPEHCESSKKGYRMWLKAGERSKHWLEI